MGFQFPLWRRSRLPISFFLLLISFFSFSGLFLLNLRSIDPSSYHPRLLHPSFRKHPTSPPNSTSTTPALTNAAKPKDCATVEEMGQIFRRGYLQESLQVRRLIHNHFALNGASRVRQLNQQQFCSHGFVIGKASEAGLGNELYKILTAAALSVMLNRSLIIGQTRHIGSLSSLSVNTALDLCLLLLPPHLTLALFDK